MSSLLGNRRKNYNCQGAISAWQQTVGGGEQAVANNAQNSERRPTRRGFLNPEMVRGLSFWTTSVCIVVAVMACLLAIWEFTGTDVLWRTVATCAVIGGGTLAFAWVNALFGDRAE